MTPWTNTAQSAASIGTTLLIGTTGLTTRTCLALATGVAVLIGLALTAQPAASIRSALLAETARRTSRLDTVILVLDCVIAANQSFCRVTNNGNEFADLAGDGNGVVLLTFANAVNTPTGAIVCRALSTQITGLSHVTFAT